MRFPSYRSNTSCDQSNH